MKRGFTLIEFAVTVAFVGIFAAIIAPVFMRTHCSARRETCQSNLKNICLGALMYTQDYDDTLPRAAAGKPLLGWADYLQPYLARSQGVLQCPSEQTTHPIPGAYSTLYTDYWMNQRVSGLALKRIRDSAHTFLFGDGNEGTACSYARYAITELPPEWVDNDRSPLYRHIEGANYAFADGHVKWFPASKITGPNGIGNLVFAPR